MQTQKLAVNYTKTKLKLLIT